ncbi:MAG TPA: VCBS repeat-containing protein [Planctomycetota bacterium]|nr:VCBS repeat-containing protein [Planctomycetota bacterium]
MNRSPISQGCRRLNPMLHRILWILGALSAATPAFAQAPWPLFPAQRLVSDLSERALALADLDNDGNLDLVSNKMTAGIGVRFGNGLGGFSPMVSYDLGTSYTRAIRAGDLENDGDVDVVYARPALSDFFVLHNSGSGVLVAGTPVALPSPPVDIQLGELDGLPGLDAAVSCTNGAVSLHFGDGLGGFAGTLVLTPGPNSGALAVGDFNADGIDDIAVVAASSIVLYLAQGGGAFVPLAPLVDTVRGIVIADVSGDAKPDLVCSTFSSFARVWLGNGLGGFNSAVQVPVAGGNGIGVAVQDFDLDGLNDFAVVSFNDESVSVLRALGAGAFAPFVAYPAAYRAQGIVAGRIDRDAGPDLIIGQDSSGGPLLLQGNGSGSFLSGIEFPGGGGAPGGIFRGDFDNNGIDDIGFLGSGTVTTRLGDGVGGFSNPITSLQASNAYDPHSADFNTDGFDDLVFGSLTFPLLNGNVRVCFGDGTGKFNSGPTIPASSGVYQVATADIDGDGDIDFAYVAGNALQIQLNQGNGAFSAGPTTPGISTSAVDLELAFLNGDAVLDAIVSVTAGALRFDGLGAGAFAPPVQVASSPNGVALALADFDGDQDLDLATSYYQSGPMRLWTNDGVGNYSLLGTLPFAPTRLRFVDVDRDGRPELVGLDGNQDFMLVWSGGPNGPLSPPQGFRTGMRPFDLVELQSRAGTPLDLAVLGDTLFVLEGISPAPASGLVYCTAKLNSLGCLPQISASGSASASASSGFVLSAANVRNNKPGLCLYGLTGRAATPFSGGFLCLVPPVRRSGALSSGGNPLPSQDCSGVYSIDMNAFAASSGPPVPSPLLSVAGVTVNCQFWGRDPGFPAPSATSLSDAIEYTVAP